MGSWGSRVAQMFELGRQHAQQEKEFAQREEDRKLQREMHAWEMKRLKLQASLEQKQIAQKQAVDAYHLMQGQPGARAPFQGPGSISLPPQEAPGAPQSVRDILMQARQRGVGGMEVAGAAGQGELRHPPINIPLPGMPAGYEEIGVEPTADQSVTVRPQTMQELFELDRQKKEQANQLALQLKAKEVLMTPQKLGQEDLVIPGLGVTIKGRPKEQRPGIDVPLPTDVEAQKERLAKAGRSQIVPGDANTAKDIAAAIIDGDQPPEMKGLYRYGAAVRAELARKDFNMSKSNLEWQGAQRWMATANGSQQLRLRQAVEKIDPHVDMINDLYSQLQKTGLPTGYKSWNRLALTAAKNLPGETGALATNLEAQIKDLAAELGNIYMGGNTPTDQSLKMAESNLKTDWNAETFRMALDLIKKNVILRRNAIRFTGPSGVPVDSPYMPTQLQGGNPETATPTATSPNLPAEMILDGKRWVLQANGKYMRQ